MDGNTKSERASAHSELTAPQGGPPEPSTWRVLAGRLVSIGAIVLAVVLSFWVWKLKEQHPRTDDAVARANVVGIVPLHPSLRTAN